MKKRYRIIFINIILITLSLVSIASGLTITEPKVDTIFHPGDKVAVKVQPALGENIRELLITSVKMHKYTIVSQLPYEFQFTVDADFTGTEVIVAHAKLVDGTSVDARVQINVVLPSGVTLKSVDIFPNPVFLSKLPQGSDPKRVRVLETKSLSIAGVFSDGIKRDITSPAAGTAYVSSNEKIVTVDSNGKVKAQGVGTATITVKNGELKAVVKVIVKTKNR